MATRKRDYTAEYARRIARGLSQGLSRSQARGHPRSREVLASRPKEDGLYNRRLELGFKAIEQGKTLGAAAKSTHVSTERLRRYLVQQGVAEKRKHRWIVLPDNRTRHTLLFTRGRARKVVVSRPQASDIGRYMGAVGEFLSENNPDLLSPYIDRGVTDIKGRYHPFETDPNTLYRLALAEAESFEQVYRITI